MIESILPWAMGFLGLVFMVTLFVQSLSAEKRELLPSSEAVIHSVSAAIAVALVIGAIWSGAALIGGGIVGIPDALKTLDERMTLEKKINEYESVYDVAANGYKIKPLGFSNIDLENRDNWGLKTEADYEEKIEHIDNVLRYLRDKIEAHKARENLN